MPTVFQTPAELASAIGRPLGKSDWLEITQDRIDRFADATGDHQWIHVDPERADAGPVRTTIAHGYLTQSLVSYFLPQIIEVRGISMGDQLRRRRLRFPAPVPVGSRVRGSAELIEVEEAERRRASRPRSASRSRSRAASAPAA